MRILIREGQDMNEQTQQLKNTPIHIAARSGHFLIVKYLLEAGANCLITNRDGQTPLQFTDWKRPATAVSADNFEAIKSLLAMT